MSCHCKYIAKIITISNHCVIPALIDRRLGIGSKVLDQIIVDYHKASRCTVRGPISAKHHPAVTSAIIVSASPFNHQIAGSL